MMQDFFVERKRHTPEIEFKTSGELSIKGISLLENSTENYSKAISWLRDFSALTPRSVSLDLKFIYLDTSSTRSLVEIIKLLNTFPERGFNVVINWFFEKEDEDHFEVGDALKSVSLVPFNLIEVDNDDDIL
jgi:hypothetical protein